MTKQKPRLSFWRILNMRQKLNHQFGAYTTLVSYLAPDPLFGPTLNSNRPSPGNMSERGKRPPRRAASSSASATGTAAFSPAPLAKRAKTVEELAAAAANKKHGNRPKRAFAELSQATGLAAPTLQVVVDQAAKKARMKSGQRTSARADGGEQQRGYFRRGEHAGVRSSYAKDEKDFDVFKDLCEKLDTKQISTRQLETFTRKERQGTTRRERSRTTCTGAAATPLGATRQ